MWSFVENRSVGLWCFISVIFLPTAGLLMVLLVSLRFCSFVFILFRCCSTARLSIWFVGIAHIVCPTCFDVFVPMYSVVGCTGYFNFFKCIYFNCFVFQLIEEESIMSLESWTNLFTSLRYFEVSRSLICNWKFSSINLLYFSRSKFKISLVVRSFSRDHSALLKTW